MLEIESPNTETIPSTHVSSLIDLVKKSLENDEINKNDTITIKEDLTSVINNIITQSPNILTDIENASIELIKDGNLNNNKVLEFCDIIYNLKNFIYSLNSIKIPKNKTRAKLIIKHLLKYLICLLVVEGKIKIDEDPEKVNDFYMHIDAFLLVLTF